MDKTLEIELAQIRPKVLSTAQRFFRVSGLDGDPEDGVQDVLLRLWEARCRVIPKSFSVSGRRRNIGNNCISLIGRISQIPALEGCRVLLIVVT